MSKDSHQPIDLDAAAVRGAVYRDRPAGRVVIYDQDGHLMDDLTLPPPTPCPPRRKWSDTAPGRMILHVLKEHGGKMNAHALLEACGYEPSSGWFRNARDGLIEEGKVVRTPPNFFSLSDAAGG